MEILNKNVKKKSSRIIDLKFLGLFLLLMIIFSTIIYYVMEKDPSVNELFSSIIPMFLIFTIVYTIFMAFMEFIKVLNTPNKIWIISSIILIAVVSSIILDGQENQQETEILFPFLILFPLIISPKLIFLIRGNYFDKQELQKEDYFGNRIIKFLKQPKYNRKEYLLGFFLLLIGIFSLIILTKENSFLALFLLLLLFLVFRRAKDIGMPLFRTIVILLSIPFFTLILIYFDIRGDEVSLIIPLLFLMFFQIMPGNNKKEIIISRLEKNILIIILLLLLPLTLFLMDNSGF